MSAMIDTRWGGASAATRTKQEHFSAVLGHQLSAGAAAMASWRKKWPRSQIGDRFIDLDFNGGCGQLGDPDDPTDPLAGLAGSPVIATRFALDSDFPFLGLVFERNPDFIARLQTRLIDEVADFHLDRVAHDARTCPGCPGCDRLVAERRLHELVRLFHGDHNVTFWPIFAEMVRRRKSLFGLAYADPYGKDGFPIEQLVALSRERVTKRIDILINLPANVWKRTRRAALAEIAAGKHTRMAEHAERYLLDDLARIEKQFRYIRPPIGDQQWAMFFGTNWELNAPAKHLGFLNVDTPEGQRLMETLNLSKPERQGSAS